MYFTNTSISRNDPVSYFQALHLAAHLYNLSDSLVASHGREVRKDGISTWKHTSRLALHIQTVQKKINITASFCALYVQVVVLSRDTLNHVDVRWIDWSSQHFNKNISDTEGGHVYIL